MIKPFGSPLNLESCLFRHCLEKIQLALVEKVILNINIYPYQKYFCLLCFCYKQKTEEAVTNLPTSATLSIHTLIEELEVTVFTLGHDLLHLWSRLGEDALCVLSFLDCGGTYIFATLSSQLMFIWRLFFFERFLRKNGC